MITEQILLHGWKPKHLVVLKNLAEHNKKRKKTINQHHPDYSEMKENISKRKTEDETICKTRLFHTKYLVNNKKTMSSEYSTTLSQWKVSGTKSAFDDSNKAENLNNFFHCIFTPKISSTQT